MVAEIHTGIRARSVSWSLLRSREYPVVTTGGAVPAFFAGLLPEGVRLGVLTSSTKTSEPMITSRCCWRSALTPSAMSGSFRLGVDLARPVPMFDPERDTNFSCGLREADRFGRRRPGRPGGGTAQGQRRIHAGEIPWRSTSTVAPTGCSVPTSSMPVIASACGHGQSSQMIDAVVEAAGDLARQVRGNRFRRPPHHASREDAAHPNRELAISRGLSTAALGSQLDAESVKNTSRNLPI